MNKRTYPRWNDAQDETRLTRYEDCLVSVYPPKRGCIYWDTSSAGWKHGRKVRFNCYRAEIQINGVRYRKRFHDYAAGLTFLEAKVAELTVSALGQ